MWLTQAADAAIIIVVGDDRIAVPPFALGDWVAWGAEIDAKRFDDATRGMTPDQRFQYASLYVLLPTTLPDLRGHAPTPAGVDRICRTCLGRANVTGRVTARPPGLPPVVEPVSPVVPMTPERAAAVVAANSPQVLEVLAAVLARMHDASDQPGPPPKGADGGKDGKGDPGPFAGGGTPAASGGTTASPPSPTTGSATSPGTPPPTPAATR